jgi:hypothetical protein
MMSIQITFHLSAQAYVREANVSRSQKVAAES